MIFDRLLLLPRRVGWTHDLGSVVPSLSAGFNLRTDNLLNASRTNEIFADLSRALARNLRNSLNVGSSSHLLTLFPTQSIPRAFGSLLGKLPFESARIFVLFLANLTRFSFLSPRNAPCPFCNVVMHSSHFFDCDQYNELGDEPISWSDFVSLFVRREWMDGISCVFRRLYGWSRRANIFQPHIRHRVNEYYEELDWARRDRIRRAGGPSLPAIQWSLSS
jgi:hypothetical protein